MIEPSERKWVVVFSVLVMVATTIPYVMGFVNQGEDWRYTGFIFGVEDGNSYIAKMLSGASGEWLFKTPYTAYSQRGFFGFFPYLLLGKLSLASARHTSLVVLFQIFRWAGGLLMIQATYDFVALFLEGVPERRWATSLGVVGGGLGWLMVFGLGGLWQNELPLEYYSPESFGFLSLYGLPHLAFARALLLWGLTAYLRSTGRSWRDGLQAGGLWLLLGLMQPLTVLTGGALIALHLGLTGLMAVLTKEAARKARWKGQFGFALGMALLPAVVVGYTALSMLTDPFLAEWTGQNLILSPPPLDYILAYGGMLVLALFGWRSLRDDWHSDRWLFLLGWVAIFPFMAYAPYNLQRRLPEGVWVAVTILGITGFARLQGAAKRVAQVFLTASFLPTLLFVAGGLVAVQQPSLPLFRPAQEVAAFEYLEAQGQPGEVVLASYKTSNPLPAWAPMFTLVGHGPESIHLQMVNAGVEAFFRVEETDEKRCGLLEAFSVDYVVYGPAEQALGDWQPEEADFLEMIYQNQTYQIFRVAK